jgi:hypothetical protein
MRRQSVKTKQTDQDLVPAAVNCRMCELAITLELLIVKICNCSINQITNPNSVYSHSIKLQYKDISYQYTHVENTKIMLWALAPRRTDWR